MSQKEQNLEEIWHKFKTNTLAADALKEIRSIGRRTANFELDELLRHHEEEEIEDEDEVSMRDAFDDLLAFYSCVEVAAIANFIPAPLPEEFRSTATPVLCNKDVRRYYRTNYPLLLPEMLLARVAGINSKKESGAETKIVPLFLEFLHVSSIIDADTSVEMLLWFLDDGYQDGYDWETTKEILAKPRKLIEAFDRAPRHRNASEKAVDGLRKFLEFCAALDGLLSRSEEFPLLRSGMWHYHSYWFQILKGEVSVAIEAALKNFEKWSLMMPAKQLSPKETKTLRMESLASIKRTSQIVRRLTGPKYQSALGTSRQIRADGVRAVHILAK
jgi:hypothetical protein